MGWEFPFSENGYPIYLKYFLIKKDMKRCFDLIYGLIFSNNPISLV